MDFVRLGSTGLKVSKICLGAMTYGSPLWRDWVLDEEQSLPFYRRALEGGSISSTPPTSIPWAPARKCWAGR